MARGELAKPATYDVGLEDLAARGRAHEQDVLGQFRQSGWQVESIDTPPADAVAATLKAIRTGADVIYQAALTDEGAPGRPALLGRPDFLVRAELLSRLDGEARPPEPHYEVVDAKLARSAKARAVLQTSLYSALLAKVQQTEPRMMHLALGHGGFTHLKVEDYAAYERQTRRLLEAFTGGDSAGDVYPEPVEHCAICRWSDSCAAKRRIDDDLSLVAGMTAPQRKTMKAMGVPTRRGFAWMEDLTSVHGIGREALEVAQLQARLQVQSEDEGEIRYTLLPPGRDADGQLIANRGLLALPEPTAGDLFFDIEGARYYSEDGKEFGLQYLFGIVDTADLEPDGTERYTQMWAFDRAGEKAAFEELVDFITERLARTPGMHVYHYNHYEPTSIDHLTDLHQTREELVGRLMGRFATHEDEVDNLFRRGVFVDLYRVVRQGLRAGVESYSIKRLEPLCGYERQVDLRTATRHLIGFEASLDEQERPIPRIRSSWPATTRTTAGRRSHCGCGWRSAGLSCRNRPKIPSLAPPSTPSRTPPRIRR